MFIPVGTPGPVQDVRQEAPQRKSASPIPLHPSPVLKWLSQVTRIDVSARLTSSRRPERSWREWDQMRPTTSLA